LYADIVEFRVAGIGCNILKNFGEIEARQKARKPPYYANHVYIKGNKYK